MEMEKKLYEAALEGNTILLKKLLQDDPLILDRITQTFFHETPIHVAILRGHVDFSNELLTHNPRLVSEPDSLGHTPLHLASSKGDIAIVRLILSRVGTDSCLAKSKAGYVPLHLAIMKGGGRIEVVEELVRACPVSVRVRVDTGDTALHLCVKYDNFDALQVIMKVGENDCVDLLNLRNDDGNSVLHLAALYKNFEVIKYLLSTPGIDPNITNNNGLTPLNLIENSPKDVKTLEIHNFLLQCNPQISNNFKSQTKTSLYSNPDPDPKKQSSWKKFFTFDNTRLDQHRGAILIVAAILSAAISLPVIVEKSDGPILTDDYSIYSLIFVPAASIIVILISGFSLRNKLCVWLVLQLMYTSIGFLGLSFIGSMISNEDRGSINVLTLVTICILFALLLMLSVLNLIRLIVWIVVRSKVWAKKRNSRARDIDALSKA